MLFQKEKEDKNQINRLDQKRERRSRRAFFLLSPISRKTLSGKVSLCTFLKKASLTLETAMALPLFFFGVLTLLSFMDIYKVQTEHLTGLCQKAKEAGMYAYGAGGSGTETITLPDVYSYQPIGGLIPLPKIWFHNTVKVHTWNGVIYENGKDTVESQPMVYVTESGSVYHRKLGCSYLNLSVQQISGSSVKALKNAYGEKYQACELCSRGQEPAGVVYITNKSNRFHNRESCSAMWLKGEIMSSVKICMTVLLVINTWTDIRKKEICLPVLFIFLTGGILWRIRQGLLWPAGIISMGIGVFIILIALISGGMVGFGDGLLILTMGSVLGAGELAGILCGALLLCGIYSGIEYLMLKKSRSEEIPFVPFLLIGYFGGIFL